LVPRLAHHPMADELPASTSTDFPQAKPAADASKPRRRARSYQATALLIVIAAAAALVYRRHSEAPADAGTRPTPRIPVVAATARKGAIGVYVTGLGAVTPLQTITVKTRVDGELMAVSYREGQLVHKGDSLVEIDPRPYQVQLAQAEAQLLKDQAALQNAQIDLQRYESLILKSAVAQQVLMAQRATVAEDQGSVKADQANIDSAKLNIVYTHITAPLTGRVGLRLVDPGNMVSAAAGTPLVVITQTQPISIIFTIPEQQVSAVLGPVRAGRHLHVDAVDRELQSPIASGELTTVDNEIDQTTGTLKLRATLPNKNEALFPNQFVNARLLIQEKEGVTLVPNAAIQRNASATFVYVVTPNQTVNVRTVKLGVTNANESEIASGVSPNEVVVTQGVDKLQEGSRVAAEVGTNDAARAPADAATNAPVATNGQRGSRR
jgi:multidrug efflux system membrane fusion protein